MLRAANLQVQLWPLCKRGCDVEEVKWMVEDKHAWIHWGMGSTRAIGNIYGIYRHVGNIQGV